MRLFVTGVGTEVGKTWVTAAVAERLVSLGRSVAAVKPVETGCDRGVGADATLLAEACREPALARARGFHRGLAPLAPLAATLEGEAPPAGLAELVASTEDAIRGFDVGLIEGAGGALVPLDRDHDFADFAAHGGWPALVVARDGLGVLSYTLTAVEALRRRELEVVGVVLVRHGREPSQATNARILGDRLGLEAWTVGPWKTPRGNGAAVASLVDRLTR